MKKITKTLLACCMLSAVAVAGGTAVALAETGGGEVKASRNLGYAPDITVEWGNYSIDNIPQAVKDAPYQLFTATAEDVYGNDVAVKTRVYLHYLEDTKSLITVKDNKITPTNYGTYTVEYTATDEFGNVNVFTYDFACENTQTLAVVLSGGETNTVAGVQTAIADYTYQNERGFVKTKITATHAEGKAVYDLTDKTSFAPMYAGEYTVEYVCTDYNVTVKESYTLTVANNDSPVFFESANMPRYFIVGKQYTLPSVKAYHFASGKPVAITPAITVKQGKERARKLNGYDFVADKEGELEITYTIACGEKVETQTYVAQAVDVGEVGTTFDITKYFFAKDAIVTANNSYLTVGTETDGASVEFINELSARGFELEFSATPAITYCGAVNLYLKDAVDESVALKITYANPGSADGYLAINDGDQYSTKNYTSAIQTISYNDANKTVGFGVNLVIDCPKEFQGFPSGKIRFSLEMSDVRDKTDVRLYSINDNVLLESNGDNFAPQLWFTSDTQSVHKIGDLINIGALQVGDVLDDTIKVSYSVTSPNNEYVISEDGVRLSGNIDYTRGYTFRVTEYGEYRVRMSAEDSSGNKKSYAYTIVVEDIIAPNVVLQNKMPTELKVGETFTLSDLTITDDVSVEFTTKVMLLGDKGYAKEMTIGTTYKFSTAGVYHLYYMVTDEAGNMTTVYHTITVK